MSKPRKTFLCLYTHATVLGAVVGAIVGVTSGIALAGYRVEEVSAVSSAPGHPISYQIYRPDKSRTTKKHPVVVVLYGAGGSMKESNFATREFEGVRDELSQHGFVAVVPELGPAHFMNDAAIAQMDSLLNVLAKDPTLDVERVHLLGSSMGAGSALAYALCRPERVVSVVSHMGMTDFAAWAIQNPGYQPALEHAYGAAYSVNPKAYDQRSAAKHADRLSGVRVFLIHGTADSTVLPSHSVSLYRAISDCHGSCILRLVEGAKHTDDVIGGMGKDVVAFLENRLPNSPVVTGADGRSVIREASTTDGFRYFVLGKQSTKPAPALIVLSGDGTVSLSDPYFLQCGVELLNCGFICVSVDLPCHGKELNSGESEGLAGWSQRVDAGKPLVNEFAARLSRVIDDLTANKQVDKERIAICGTSRGAFLACHAAASDTRIKAIVGMAPVSSLNALDEFKKNSHSEYADELSLVSTARLLAGRPMWLVIGDRDSRVDTDQTIKFARAVTAESLRQGMTSRVELHVVPEPRGHTTPPQSPQLAARWIQQVVATAAK